VKASTRRRFLMRLAIASLVACILAASAGSSLASTAREAVTPYGTYTVNLSPKDPDVPAGVWRLRLRPGGYSLLSAENPTQNSGRLRVKGNVLTFSRETLCPSAVGRYRWRLSGRSLRLTVIGRDSCSGNDRTVVLTSKPWTKQG